MFLFKFNLSNTDTNVQFTEIIYFPPNTKTFTTAGRERPAAGLLSWLTHTMG